MGYMGGGGAGRNKGANSHGRLSPLRLNGAVQALSSPID